jgi:hypothetical protein
LLKGLPDPRPGETEEQFANGYLATIKAIDPDVIQFITQRFMMPEDYDIVSLLFDSD